MSNCLNSVDPVGENDFSKMDFAYESNFMTFTSGLSKFEKVQLP